MAGLAGGYGNIGYMGPGLALATFGTPAAVPVALIFCFDNIFLFSIVPMLMAVFGSDRRPLWPTVWHVAEQIAFHPLIVASWLGALAAAVHFNPPVAVDRTLEFLQNAAAPVALFALGVTVALRPFERVPWEVPGVVAVKLLLHPLMAFALLTLLGPFDPQWIATALLMASLPPALNAFIIARQYDTWVEAASTAVLLGTLVSVLTLTLIMWMLKSGLLGL
jgi:predicted permease